MPASTANVAKVRRFNRFYTRQIGLLRRGYLDGPFSLAEARVLYEIAHAKTAEASLIARALDLDPAYLSRMLASFEKQGLITREKSQADARRTRVKLTSTGRRAFAALDKRSEEQAESLLSQLSENDQVRLVSAMTSIESMLAQQETPKQTAPCKLRPPEAGDFGWIISRNALLYANEYGWGGPFEGLCAQIVADFLSNPDPKRGRAWIAEVDGNKVGSILLAAESRDVARIRLLFVEQAARGRGVGEQLLTASLNFAKEAGYKKVTLWTHRVLSSARKLYRRAGFSIVSREKHSKWGAPIVSETWDLHL